MNVTQIEENVKKLASDVLSSAVDKDQFIYELMAAYGHRKTTVSRIKSGERNLAKVAGEVRAKRHIYFKHSDSNKVFSDIDGMKKEPSVTREKIRFIIATDFNQFVAVDTRTNDTLDIEFGELGKHFDFFLPWAGMEKAVYQGDNPADVKAAEKMAKLFDLIKADNFNEENKNDTAALHSLNVFLTRLLFCFFAEDTGIFADNQFSAELESHTKVDGSDVDSYLNRLFKVLNTSKENRHDLPDYLAKFEYVNGGLFADAIASPKFSTKSRRMLIECGSELDWSDINPDIFGSMIQAVVHPDQRGGMGMHYTSVINIMKVIEPLFLDDLYAELENIAENIDPKLKPSRLRKLHDRIANIKIFDPACGSGNFLIIAFKELRKLEMEVIKLRQELVKDGQQDDFFDEISLDSSFSRIRLSQFYGIELDDFAHEVAILSLWLAEHQMNVEFKAEFGECAPSLPLRQSGNIVSGNATRINWESVCKPIVETYVLGNPPYKGSRVQDKEQKLDMSFAFDGIKIYKDIDYVGCWFIKASRYITENTQVAFVTTNSICQGSQVTALWPHILNKGIEISFAYKSFVWGNNAMDQAKVTCSIIGLRKNSNKKALLFDEGLVKEVKEINAYLIASKSIFIKKRTKPISDIPVMLSGNYTGHAQELMMSTEEKELMLQEYPQSELLFKKVIGSNELIKGITRWCLWIKNEDLELAKSIPPIKLRIENVLKARKESRDKEANKLTSRPHQFRDLNETNSNSLVVPTVSSERRKYMTVGIIDSSTIVTNKAMVLYEADLYIFCLITSRMHNVWVHAISGRLETRISYSSVLCYNTFPVPSLTKDDIETMRELSINVLSIRENYPSKPFSYLYDPEKTPSDLQDAHSSIDQFVDSLYSETEFKDDESRLECLFKLYIEMTGNKNA